MFGKIHCILELNLYCAWDETLGLFQTSFVNHKSATWIHTSFGIDSSKLFYCSRVILKGRNHKNIYFHIIYVESPCNVYKFISMWSNRTWVSLKYSVRYIKFPSVMFYDVRCVTYTIIRFFVCLIRKGTTSLSQQGSSRSERHSRLVSIALGLSWRSSPYQIQWSVFFNSPCRRSDSERFTDHLTFNSVVKQNLVIDCSNHLH